MNKRWQRFVPMIGGTLVVLIVVVSLVVYVYHMMHNKTKNSNRQVAQVVKIIRPPQQDTPPPPPPPPPEKIEQPIEQQPQQAPEEAPAQNLGIDADAAAGSDGFGLAARPGGRDLVGTGTGAFVWYTSMVKDSIQQTLSNDERTRKGAYQVNVRVWLKPDGRVDRIKLVSTTGSADLDSAIEAALTKLDRVREGPPLEMPQPMTYRIVSRG